MSWCTRQSPHQPNPCSRTHHLVGSSWAPYIQFTFGSRYNSTVQRSPSLSLWPPLVLPSPPWGTPLPSVTMAPRGKKPGPPKKDGRQPESLTDTPPLKGKLPVPKPQIKKKIPATGDAEGPPPSLASGASPTPQPPNSYAVAARTSMDTSELMDIEQLCAMWPQHSGTPPCSNQGPPPSAAVANLPKSNLPGQGLPPTLVTQGDAAIPASPPSSSLAAMAAGALPAAAKPAMVTNAAGLKAVAALAGPLKIPPLLRRLCYINSNCRLL